MDTEKTTGSESEQETNLTGAIHDAKQYGQPVRDKKWTLMASVTAMICSGWILAFYRLYKANILKYNEIDNDEIDPFDGSLVLAWLLTGLVVIGILMGIRFCLARRTGIILSLSCLTVTLLMMFFWTPTNTVCRHLIQGPRYRTQLAEKYNLDLSHTSVEHMWDDLEVTDQGEPFLVERWYVNFNKSEKHGISFCVVNHKVVTADVYAIGKDAIVEAAEKEVQQVLDRYIPEDKAWIETRAPWIMCPEKVVTGEQFVHLDNYLDEPTSMWNTKLQMVHYVMIARSEREHIEAVVRDLADKKLVSYIYVGIVEDDHMDRTVYELEELDREALEKYRRLEPEVKFEDESGHYTGKIEEEIWY